MKIRYHSRHGVPYVVIPQLLDAEWQRWSQDQERDVPDDMIVAVKLDPTGPVRQAKLLEVLLCSGPEFRDAATGVNPDFACHTCGCETLSEWFPAVDDMSNLVHVPYADAAGNRLCPKDYLLAQGPDSIAWRWHSVVEHSSDYAAAHSEHKARAAQDDTARRAALGTTKPAEADASRAPAASFGAQIEPRTAAATVEG